MRTESIRCHGGDCPEHGDGQPLGISIFDDAPHGSILPEYWTAVDALDADRVACHFDPGATFQLGRQPSLRGRKVIRRAFVHLFTEAEFMRHDAVTVWYKQGLTVADADVRIILGNGTIVMVPITTILRQRQGQILACRVYLPAEPSLVHAVRDFRSRQEPCRLVVRNTKIPDQRKAASADSGLVNSC
jgi:hypothetical protein